MAEAPGGQVRQRMLAVERASRIISRAESELRRAYLPDAARKRVDQAIEALKGVCAAFGPPDGGAGR